MKKLLFIATIVSFLFCLSSTAQVDCSNTNINNVPGKWVWDKRGGGDYAPSTSQWQICEPIKKEVLRIMPQPFNGLHATISIAFSNNAAIANNSTSPKSYDCYLKLKKFECLKQYNKLQPEGETGCWAYFNFNRIPEKPGALHFGYYENESSLYVGDFYTEKDAAGNRILYISDFGRPAQKMGYYFAAKDRLPLRKISWKELALSYKTFTEKEISSKLIYAKEGLSKNEKELTTTQYADTKEYLTKLIADRKLEIKKMEEEKAALQNWYNTILQHKKINDPALVKQTRLQEKEITNLINSNDNTSTYPVWIDDISFYNPAIPKEQPQCIYFWLRRQDSELPKKIFMDLMYANFNMDILCRMVGEPVKKPGGINTIAVR